MTTYISTRGSAPVLGFADAALAGMAADGGLYVPAETPVMTDAEFDDLSGQDYLETAWRVISRFTGNDVPTDDLRRLLQSAYAGFDAAGIAPLRQLEDGLYVQELFHGPTLAFKDIALQFLGRLFDYFLEKTGSRVTIVGATSGDTGSAAIEAFCRSKYADIVILHPKGRVSDVQRLQMTTVEAPNVTNIAIEGSFDDCQDLVKAMFADETFRRDMRLSAVNSINWARILAQAVYYVYAGAQLRASFENPVVFSVPTGNFGNVYAGYVAQAMNMSVEKFLVATNANDILHRFFTGGRMEKAAVVQTISPSMDIQVASNFERLLFDIYARDGAMVAQTMRHFREKGPFGFDAALMQRLNGLFQSGRKDDGETRAVIADTYRKYGYLADPHTAIGLGVAQDYRQKNPSARVVALATAHPAKFPDAVMAATGITPDVPEKIRGIFGKREYCDTLPADLSAVQAHIRAKGKAA